MPSAARPWASAGMRERGLMLGGKVIIFSHPGQGTTVQAFIPMHKDRY